MHTLNNRVAQAKSNHLFFTGMAILWRMNSDIYFYLQLLYWSVSSDPFLSYDKCESTSSDYS